MIQAKKEVLKTFKIPIVTICNTTYNLLIIFNGSVVPFNNVLGFKDFVYQYFRVII
jgi:hypothetical protein